MSKLPDNPSQSLKRLNPHLYPKEPVIAAPSPVSAPKKGVPVNVKKPKVNKTEARYFEYLKRMNPGEWISAQCLTFVLANDCRFTPDVVMIGAADKLVAIDVKAKWKGTKGPHVEDDALVKLKVAARTFPWCLFYIAWEENGHWEHRQIEP